MIRIFTLFAFIQIACAAQAQNFPWGWGPEIYVNQIGSTITCTAFDPALDMTRTQSFTAVSNWIHEDGVVATVSLVGTVQGIVYDIELGNFSVGQFNSFTGTSITNRDGVIAWVSASGTLGAAIYDPFQHQWRSGQFSSSSGNQLQNRDGVVSWVSSAGVVGAAVYDPALSTWRSEELSSNTGNTVRNADGVVAWVSSAGSVGAALYDPSMHAWRTGQLSTNAGNATVLGQGVVAWKSTSGSLGAAAYDFETNVWESGQFSTAASNSMPTITGGTVEWTNMNGPQRYGYTSAHQWQNNALTSLQCEYYPINASGSAEPHIAYLWCLSIGASSYSHNCDDGHTITRRWGWKAYADDGVYYPTLSISNASNTSTCNGELALISTQIDAVRTRSNLNAYFVDGGLQVRNDVPLGQVQVFDASGRCVATTMTNANACELPGPFALGIYAIRAGGNGTVSTVRVCNAR
ncbi:MAG: hypothetical protein KBA60_05300 [Flavobacteriales bacterium]|nr:hypothetical protein [Flavobacteriales bacterium]MBP7155401.1 hypothetical protein [Flavobacteriales bacterium]HQV74900.1 hypothetical protein [Flavobacteriales bacterium]